MKPHEEHKAAAPKFVKVSLITVSTSRYEKLSKGLQVEDESGSLAFELVKKAGHEIVSRKIVDDDVSMIRRELIKSIYEEGADAVILMGGTGLAKRDVTIEAIRPLLQKELDGFAELFRNLSYKEVGTAAYLTRCIAGTVDGKAVYCLPGSPSATKTGLELILQELTHVIHMARS